MNRQKLLFLLLFSFIFVYCAGGTATKTLEEPVGDDSILIIGGIIFETDGYQNRYDLYKKNIEVAIIGFYMENGEEKVFFEWVETDDNGLFYYANARPGKYEIKAFRLYIKGGLFLGIGKDYRSMVDAWNRTDAQNIVASGIMFDKEATNRILNFKYNYFSIYSSGEVQHNAEQSIVNLLLTSGEVVDAPFIFDEFITKFEGSEWLTYLNMERSKYK